MPDPQSERCPFTIRDACEAAHRCARKDIVTGNAERAPRPAPRVNAVRQSKTVLL